MRSTLVPQATRERRCVGRDGSVEQLCAALAQHGARVLLLAADGAGARQVADGVARREWRNHKTQWWLDASTEASLLLGLSELGWQYPACDCEDTGDGSTLAAAEKLLAEHDDWLLVLEGAPTGDAAALAAILAHLPAGRGRALVIGAAAAPAEPLPLLTAQHSLGALTTEVSVALLFTAADVSQGWEADGQGAAVGAVEPELAHALGVQLQNLPLGVSLLGKLLAADERRDGGTPSAQSVRLRAPSAVAEVKSRIGGAGPAAPATHEPGSLALAIGLAALRASVDSDKETLVRAEALLFTVALLAQHGCSAVPDELFDSGDWEAELDESAERASGKLLRRQAKETWVEDRSVLACQICGVSFSTRRRRHHCRQCGRVVCNPCSRSKAELPRRGHDSAVRLCDRCVSSKIGQDVPGGGSPAGGRTASGDDAEAKSKREAKEHKKALAAALKIWGGGDASNEKAQGAFGSAAQALVDIGLLEWQLRQAETEMLMAGEGGGRQGLLWISPGLAEHLMAVDGTAPALEIAAGGSLPPGGTAALHSVLRDIVADFSGAVRKMTSLHGGRQTGVLSAVTARKRRKAARLYPVAVAMLEMDSAAAARIEAEGGEEESGAVFWRAELAGALGRCLAMCFQAGGYQLAEQAFQTSLQLIEAGRDAGRRTIASQAAAEALAMMSAAFNEGGGRNSRFAVKMAKKVAKQARSTSPPPVQSAIAAAAAEAALVASLQCDDLEVFGDLLLQQGRAAPAAQLLGAVVGMRTELSGGLHEETLASTALWARALEASGQWGRAIEAGVRNLRVLEHVLGKTHPTVAMACDAIAATCERQSAAMAEDAVDFELAIGMRLRALTINSLTVGREDAATGTAAKRLALTYLTAAHTITATAVAAGMQQEDVAAAPLVASSRLSPDALHATILRYSVLTIAEIPYQSVGDLDPMVLLATNRHRYEPKAQSLDSMGLDAAETAAMAALVRARREERTSEEEVVLLEPEPEPELQLEPEPEQELQPEPDTKALGLPPVGLAPERATEAATALSGLTLRALKTRAKALLADPAQVSEVDDTDDPKAAVIELVLSLGQAVGAEQ